MAHEQIVQCRTCWALVYDSKMLYHEEWHRALDDVIEQLGYEEG